MHDGEKQPRNEDTASELARGWTCYVTEPREALRIADRVTAENPGAEACQEALLLRGCAFCLLGEFVRGAEVLKDCVEIQVEFPAPHQARRALLAWGIAEFRSGHSTHAFALWERARKASAALNDPDLEGNALLQMGIALSEQGDVPGSVDRLLAALALYEGSGYQRGVAVARGNLGNTLLQIGEYDRAAEHFLAGQRILEAAGDRRGCAVGLASLGRVQLKMGRVEAGIASLHQAAETFQEMGLRLEEAISLCLLGEALLLHGNVDQAVHVLGAAISLADSSGASQYSLRARVACAEALATSGDRSGAATLLRHCLAETTEPDREPLRVHVLMAIARARSAAPADPAWEGLPAEVEALQQVASIASDTAELSQAHARLAEGFEAAGDVGAALAHYKEHLRFAKVEAEKSGRQAVARVEVELTVERLRRRTEQVEENNRLLSEALELARRESARAEEASQAKTNLINILAHDLRSPLAHISLSAELLVDQPDTNHLRSELGMIVLSAQRANRLVRSLVDGAAMDEGRLKLRPALCDIAAVVRTICGQLEVFARDKQQALRLVGVTTLPAVIDMQRVEQVVQNLVDNAIKFSSPHAVTEVELIARQGRAVMIVRDHGPGMSAADLAQAFSPYAVRSAEPTGREPSTGLGLSITRQLVEAMGGTIAVHSEGLGCGCTFTVDLATHLN